MNSKNDNSSCRMWLKKFSASWPTENVTFFNSIKRQFKWLNGYQKSFSAFDKSKILFWSGRESNVSSDRHALRTYFLPFDQPKMRLVWSREIKVSRPPASLWTLFRPLEHPKMRLGWGRENDDSRARMALSIYHQPVDQPKIQHGWIQKPTFLVVAGTAISLSASWTA